MYIAAIEEGLFSSREDDVDKAKRRIGLLFSAIEFGEKDRLAALWEEGEEVLSHSDKEELRDYLTMLLLAGLIAKSTDSSLMEHLALSDAPMTRKALTKVAEINDNWDLMQQLNMANLYTAVGMD